MMKWSCTRDVVAVVSGRYPANVGGRGKPCGRQVDGATAQGAGVALLGEPDAGDGRRTVHGRGRGVWGGGLPATQRGHPLAVEPDGQRPLDHEPRARHAQTRPQPAAEHHHGVQDAQRQPEGQLELPQHRRLPPVAPGRGESRSWRKGKIKM